MLRLGVRRGVGGLMLSPDAKPYVACSDTRPSSTPRLSASLHKPILTQL